MTKTTTNLKSTDAASAGTSQFTPKITIFHCVNAVPNCASSSNGRCEIDAVKLPCSSIIREVFLLRAFEAGADAVVVLACPEKACRNIDGNIRAAKRVARMKKMVDDIGLDGRRLNLYNVAPGDKSAVERIVNQTVNDLASLGRNPAA